MLSPEPALIVSNWHLWFANQPVAAIRAATTRRALRISLYLLIFALLIKLSFVIVIVIGMHLFAARFH